MINKLILIGNVGSDADIHTLDTGAKVAKFSVATNENYKDKSGEWQTNTEWHNIVCWRDLAEKAEQLKKGNLVYIEGKLTHRSYEDKDGIKRYVTEVVANYFRVINRGKGSADPGPTEPPQYQQGGTPTSEPVAGGAADDELPF